MIEIPDYIKPETWAAFVELRRLKGQRAPLTEFGAQRVVAKLVDIHKRGYDADYALAECVERGYTSVYVNADTPRRNGAAEMTGTYLAEIKAHKATKPPAEVKAKLDELRAATAANGLRRVR